MPRQLLRNGQGERIKDLLPGKAGDPGATAKDNRLFIEAVLWIGRTGSQWRDLHLALGNWHNTYTRFARWGKNGVWQRIYDRHIYKDRNLIERFCNRIKQFRRIATRYDKLARNYLSMLNLVCAYIWTN